MPLSLESITIRNLEKDDNTELAKVVRDTLAEFGANKPGTVFFDPTTDHLFEVFDAEPKAHYFLATYQNKILGGGGIYPSEGLPPDTCELVKMYLLPEARGIGLGSKLIELCIAKAKENGFDKIYIETMPELKQAMSTYEKFGFKYLNGPMGNTGHFGCEIWMAREGC